MEDAVKELLGVVGREAEPREDKELTRRAAEAMDEEAGQKGESEEPEGEPEGPGTAPLPVGVVGVAPVGK